jgi:hypothetical protein
MSTATPSTQEGPAATASPRPAADVARSSRRASTKRSTSSHASVVHAHSHRTKTRRTDQG